MAIVEMSKLSIVGLNTDKSDMLSLLIKRGLVQIDDSAYLLEEEEYGQTLHRDSAEADVIQLEQKISLIGQCLESIQKYVTVKKPMFAPKRGYRSIESEAEEDKIFETAVNINMFHRDLESAKNEENAAIMKKEMLLPWASLDVELHQLETKHSKMILGTFPTTMKLEHVRSKLEEVALESVVNVVKSDKQFDYCYVIAHKEVYDNAMEALKEFGFVPAALPRVEGTAQQGIKEFEKLIDKRKKEQQQLQEDIKAFADMIPALENLYDYYTIEKQQKKAHEKLVKTENTFCLTGWVASKEANRLTEELTSKFNCVVETQQGNKEEGYPILLENNSLVTPFESITNMYSCPSTKDIDPNSIMSFFYIVFFGMMLSDAGYGVVIALVSFFIVKKAKMKKGEGNLFKLLGWCGISTIVWGCIFGGIFGDLIAIPTLINPLEDVMVLMGLSLLFGIIHIYVGLGIKGYMLIRDGKAIDALFDVGLWYVFVTGICLLVIPVVAGPIGIWSEVGKYLSIIGAVGLILTQGRSFKGIFMKGFKGVSSLYGITSYFADILSYSRLMALCLSTGVIGQVINLLGDIAGPIPAIFIGVIGHTANLLINALGAYVHTSRLQYVEFFGKFFEGGGSPFEPFKRRTKYTAVSSEQD
ncbi:MAG TPA: V-type ATP synthase subunit I [Candidatus Coprocola pullicola]|nr:V-type ATP synthase subunit I [Candidatus Coprocola pullicola]